MEATIHKNRLLICLFCSICPSSSPPSLASSDKIQSGEASSSWNYARPAGTLASPLPPVSAPPPHPAAQMTPPASLETRTIADGGKSPRYERLRGLSVIYGPVFRSGRCGAGPLMPASGDELGRGNFSDGYFLWEVCLEEGLPDAVLKWSWYCRSLADFVYWFKELKMDISFLYLLQMVLKINAIFEARRGKKRMKRVSQSTESSSGRGEKISCPPLQSLH